MRARNIKPGFFRNEDLLECDPLTRILFAGLWCMADKAGRLEDRPKRIKIEVLPCDNCDIDAMLDKLHSHGFIERYSVDGARFISIVNFGKHQTPHHREPESTVPPPPEQADNRSSLEQKPKACPGLAQGQPQANPGVAQDKSGESPGTDLGKPGSSPVPACGKHRARPSDSAHTSTSMVSSTFQETRETASEPAENHPVSGKEPVPGVLEGAPDGTAGAGDNNPFDTMVDAPKSAPGKGLGKICGTDEGPRIDPKPRACPGLAPGQPKSSPSDSLIPDSLIPDSLIPDTGLSDSGLSVPSPLAQEQCRAVPDAASDNPKPENEAIPYAQVVSHLNAKSGKSFRPSSDQTRRLIKARWNQGFRMKDFLDVIDCKCSKWLSDPKMADFVRPETLFGTKFESYLNEARASPPALSGMVSEQTRRTIANIQNWRPKNDARCSEISEPDGGHE